ncbi:MAG: class I SAM-dependent methyltransferase, partial [Streptomyces sp.]|nr:class I SAM-dependent methyltransferase [Streptomyces sp.]
RWLAERGTPYFTASRAHAPEIYDRLWDVKRKLALGLPLRDSHHNPMIFFNLP